MIDLTRSLDIAAPASRVWAVLADYRRDPEWRTGVLSMEPDTPGLAQPGTRVHEVLRLAGTTSDIGSVVDAVAPGRRVDWHTTSGSDADGFRMVEPIDDGRCRVSLGITVRPHGAERLLVPMVRRLLGRNLAGDLDRLRDLVAAEAAAPLTGVQEVR